MNLKRIIQSLVLAAFAVTLSSCALFKKPCDCPKFGQHKSVDGLEFTVYRNDISTANCKP